MKRAELPSFGNLNGIRVVTTGTNIAGPVAATFLAEQGAEVIHIESTKAPDMLRRMGRAWTMEHRNGRSMALNIPDPGGKKIFLKLLEEAVLEERGEEKRIETECAADLTVNAHIPDRYVPSAEQRMDLYRRIAAIRTDEDASDLLDEMLDRYGEAPKSVLALLDVALLRSAAAKAGVSDISQKGSLLRLQLGVFHPQALVAVCGHAKYRQRLTLAAGEIPALTLKLKPGEDVLEAARDLVEDLKLAAEEAAGGTP